MIELICPSYGRPEKMARMWQSARMTAYEPDKLLLRLGINEEQISLYKPHVSGMTGMYAVRDWSTVYTLNMISQHSVRDGRSKLIMIVGDDAIFTTPHWDKALREHYNALEQKIHVYSLLDSRSPDGTLHRSHDGTPHPIVTREYIQAMGYLATPIFLHWFVDTWMVDIAKANGCFTHMKDYLLTHDKPSDEGLNDETHNRIRDRGWLDRDNFTNERCQHFLAMEKERLERIISHTLGIREHLD